MPAIEVFPAGRNVGAAPVSALLRLRVFVRRSRIDGVLADGSSPEADPRLTLRAAQLARPGLRATLADSLLRVARSIDGSPGARFPRPEAPIDAASVRACSPELCDLARALTDVNPRTRGVAITRLLLTDGCSPLYAKGSPEGLRDRLNAARAAL